ncbi:MAG: hypothetical protein KatS3mg081_0347 [Gemmatimonadales bacterium]|nr:MAG: hypothetical protein KatS3mg081_0347 [Gemmatimonadales bacterium]
MWLLGFADDQRAYGYSEPKNEPTIAIWELELADRRGRTKR